MYQVGPFSETDSRSAESYSQWRERTYGQWDELAGSSDDARSRQSMGFQTLTTSGDCVFGTRPVVHRTTDNSPPSGRAVKRLPHVVGQFNSGN